METVLDVVLIVAGIIWSLIFLVLLLAVVLVFVFARRYLRKAHQYLQTDVAGVLAAVLGQAEAVRERTAGLPGRVSTAVVPVPRGSLTASFPFPFFRRRRPWWQRILRQ